MAILAENNGTKREPIPQGNYVARCYQMIEIGTVKEEFEGVVKMQKKVRLGWELPTELKVFNEEKGEQPCVISGNYTLSMHEKSKLRGFLQSWRGKAFSDEDAKSFDITKLLGVPCMLNIIHKTTPNGTFANIASVSPLPKGLVCPDQINPSFVLSYDVFDYEKFLTLPDWIKTEMEQTQEYKNATTSNDVHEDTHNEPIDDLPF